MTHQLHRHFVVSTLRSRRRAQRAARRELLALRRDLSEFSTPAELAELSALLGRHDDGETESLRRLVDWHVAA